MIFIGVGKTIRLISECCLSVEDEISRAGECYIAVDLAFLAEGDYPNFKLLDNNGSIATALKNLTSGIIPVPDMLLIQSSIF